MTVLCAALLAIQTPALSVAEVPVAGSGKVVVQAFVPAPKDMSDREAAAWYVLADALSDGTQEFSRDRLREYGSQAGTVPLIEAWPDVIKIQIVEPKEGLNVASQLVESLCLRASLTDDAVKQSVTNQRGRRLSPWSEALFDLDLPWGQVTPELVRNVYTVAFRPSLMTFVFGGEVQPGEGTAQVEKRFAKPLDRPPQRTRFDRAPHQRTRHAGSVFTFEARSTAVRLEEKGAAQRLLAVFALGVGKEGAMHRVLRDSLGFSYRQEAVLWPTSAGWVPRFVFARATGDGVLESGATAWDALKKDVDGWNAATLARAQAMARSSLEGANPLCPFWTSLGGPMTGSIEDKCSWTGFCRLASHAPVPVTDFDSVTVEELKSEARLLLETARYSLIPGSG